MIKLKISYLTIKKFYHKLITSNLKVNHAIYAIKKNEKQIRKRKKKKKRMGP